jgi:uncharacterized protein (TIGR00369 family)
MAQARITAEELERIGRERVPMAGLMGLRVDEVEHGRVTVRVPCQESFVRPGGTVAGPVLMAAADFAMYGVVMSLVGPVELVLTTHLSINFLRRPAMADVLARGQILKLGRRLAVGEVSLYCGEAGSLVAHATCTYSIPPEPLAEGDQRG